VHCLLEDAAQHKPEQNVRIVELVWGYCHEIAHLFISYLNHVTNNRPPVWIVQILPKIGPWGIVMVENLAAHWRRSFSAESSREVGIILGGALDIQYV
jgi:hypothetical protein